MSEHYETKTPTWEDTIHNDARKFGHIDEFAKVAYSLGYKYISWNDRIYEVWADESGFIWTGSTNIHRSAIK